MPRNKPELAASSIAHLIFRCSARQSHPVGSMLYWGRCRESLGMLIQLGM